MIGQSDQEEMIGRLSEQVVHGEVAQKTLDYFRASFEACRVELIHEWRHSKPEDFEAQKLCHQRLQALDWAEKKLTNTVAKAKVADVKLRTLEGN